MTELAMTAYVGREVDLVNMRATAPDGAEIHATGRYRVEEYNGEDRGAGILAADFILSPVGHPDDEWESVALSVDPDELLKVLDPQRVERERTEEARWEAEALRGAEENSPLPSAYMAAVRSRLRAELLRCFIDGDEWHQDGPEYRLVNLLEALKVVPDTGDWHAEVKSLFGRLLDSLPDRKSLAPNRSAADQRVALAERSERERLRLLEGREAALHQLLNTYGAPWYDKPGPTPMEGEGKLNVVGRTSDLLRSLSAERERPDLDRVRQAFEGAMTVLQAQSGPCSENATRLADAVAEPSINDRLIDYFTQKGMAGYRIGRLRGAIKGRDNGDWHGELRFILDAIEAARPDIAEEVTRWTWEPAEQGARTREGRVCPEHGDARNLSWCDICGKKTVRVTLRAEGGPS